jgi:hypothetical protein
MEPRQPNEEVMKTLKIKKSVRASTRQTMPCAMLIE